MLLQLPVGTDGCLELSPSKFRFGNLPEARFFDAVTFSGAGGGDVVVVTENVASVAESVGARGIQGHASLRSVHVGDRHYFLSMRDPAFLPRGWASAILDRRVRRARSADASPDPPSLCRVRPTASRLRCTAHACTRQRSARPGPRGGGILSSPPGNSWPQRPSLLVNCPHEIAILFFAQCDQIG